MNRLFPEDMNIYMRILLSFLASSGRYLLLSGGAFLIWYVVKKHTWIHKKIQQRFPRPVMIITELKFSLSTIIMFTIYGAVMFLLRKYLGINGHLYADIHEHSWLYFIFSILMLIAMHDTYFYWTHRFMHLRGVYKYVHKIHHHSVNPTPLAVYSFHPLEAIVNGGFVVFALFTIPIHLVALIIFLVIFILTDLMLHLGYELLPKNFVHHPILKYINTATHHNMHHQYVRSNYGLYFNFWDRLMHTQDDRYTKRFDEVAGRTR